MFGRFVIFRAFTWGHCWIILGYIGNILLILDNVLDMCFYFGNKNARLVPQKRIVELARLKKSLGNGFGFWENKMCGFGCNSGET